MDESLKLTPFSGDGNREFVTNLIATFMASLKLTPFSGDGNSIILSHILI